VANTSSNQRIPLEQARNSLAKVWFPGAGLTVIIIIVQIILGRYQGSVQEVWAWFQPTVFPTTALILGVMGAVALQPDSDQRTVNRFYFSLSRGLTIFYLLILLLILLLDPFAPVHGMDLFNTVNYFLPAIQSIVVGVITVLFTSQEKTASPPAAPNQP
jgi:hypothetical protein